ncbi:nuclear RNA export factor 1-like [Monodelphis domestica]|uniref:Nuclear RNA export factor 1 n=1 Tax=Monodelphis domestica TaxID=13616 RepID=F6PYN9_MONDO|nr:nuclear RNA export factor 1-like [Monodelphis domestica]
MADQGKPEGKSRGKSENKSYGELGAGGSSCSENSSAQRLKKSRGGSLRRKYHSESKSSSSSSSGSRGYSQGPPRSAREDRDDPFEGQEASRARYSPHRSRIERGKWWERGGSRIHATVKRREREKERERHSLDRGVALSNQIPLSKQWFKVTISNGRNYDKTWLLSTLRGKCNVALNPVDFHYDDKKALFFVEDPHIASALKAADHNIVDGDNRRISIVVNTSSPPYSVQNELKPEQLEQLKIVMSKRYDNAKKTLSLKGLRSEPDLMIQCIDIVLNRKNYMTALVQIIGENIPELLSLNLSNNRIYKLDDFADIVHKAPNLRSLNLSCNELKSERELDKVKELKLDELWLVGNPLCKSFRNRASYLTAIRERFPKLLRLDGHDLAPSVALNAQTRPPVALNVEMPALLPACKGSFFGSETLKGMVTYFLQQYFSVYDSGDRQGLLDAYHEEACCSLSISANIQNPSQYNMSEYVKDNRNVKKVKDPGLRFHLLKHSRLAVITFINELPKTQHDMSSFVVDVCAQTETLLCFSVHGLFKEVEEKSNAIRAFTRMFIAVPSNNATRMCMVNDELFVRNANPEEIHRAFAAVPAPPTSSFISMVNIFQEQQSIIQLFSTQSGMNLEWSKKCLQDNNWDFPRAAQIFTQLKVEGKIPAVAFQK